MCSSKYEYLHSNFLYGAGEQQYCKDKSDGTMMMENNSTMWMESNEDP